MSGEWVVTPRPKRGARLRLFCFHSAGSGASMFIPWAAFLPEDVELNIIQMPGRENRLKDTPYKRIERVISELTDVVFPLLDRPFAVFGLSLGALVGFEFVHMLRQLYSIEPVHFYAASRRAPQTSERLPLISHLPDMAFLEAIQDRYNSIPEVIWKDADLMQLFLPLLRADFTLLEAYTYSEGTPLTCPLSVLYGDADNTINHEDLEAWQSLTLGPFNKQSFSGGHFFLTNQMPAILEFLSRHGLGGNGR